MCNVQLYKSIQTFGLTQLNDQKVINRLVEFLIRLRNARGENEEQCTFSKHYG